MSWIELEDGVYGESIEANLKSILTIDDINKILEEKTMQVTMFNSEISELQKTKEKIEKDIEDILLLIEK